MNPLKTYPSTYAQFLLFLALTFFVAGCGPSRQPTPTATPTSVLPTVQAILAPKITEIPATMADDAVAESTENGPSIEPTEVTITTNQSVVTVGDLLAIVGADPDSAESANSMTAAESNPVEAETPELAPTSTAAPTPNLRPATVVPDLSTNEPIVAAIIAPTETETTVPIVESTTAPPTNVPTAVPTVAPTVAPTIAPIAASDPAALPNPPNELGAVLVLEYHLIEPGEDSTYSRTPESVLSDLKWLYANNFYPIKFRDLAEGTIDIPAGKSPVVLAFDDSSIGQFRFLADGTVDPTSAMGVILDFAASRADFPPVITAFPLLDVDVPSRILWGQPELANRKLQMIVEWGGEIGSHTVSHERLDLVGEERIQWQLANSTQWLEERIGNGYEVRSLALPLGAYPLNEALLRSGESEGISYRFTGAAEVAGGPAFSPFSTGHDPYHIRRAQAVPGYIDNIFSFLANRPSLKYTSDGDPQTITIPSEETLDEEQRGTFEESAWSGYRVVRYERE